MRKLDCPLKCDVPDGVEVFEVPEPRHNWSDVVHCPNSEEGCARHFLVKRAEAE